MNLTLQKQLFGLTSALTDLSPRQGARFLDATVRPLIQHPALRNAFHQKNLQVLRRAGTLRRVLILSDIHLGDAVMLQGFPAAIRDFFPEAETHYVVSRAAAPFVAGHPDVSVLHPLYRGGSLPSAEDHESVRSLIRDGGFDLIVNACPFFTPGHPLPTQGPLLDFLSHAPRLVENEYDPTEPNHFIFQGHRFLVSLLRELHPPRRAPFLRGARVFLDDASCDEAARFAEETPLTGREPRIFLNADTASPFTKPPEDFCADLLLRWTAHGARVWMGEGHTDRGIGRRLIEALPAPLRDRVRLVPAALPARAYAALIDHADVFVSGDTGPLHWAAARKESATGRRTFRNRTSVVGLFGATPPRMSGYDSDLPGYLPAWQGAPSKTFVSAPPCRNLTCLNKLHKTCRVHRCFEGMAAPRVAEAVMRLAAVAEPAAVPAAAPQGVTV